MNASEKNKTTPYTFDVGPRVGWYPGPGPGPGGARFGGLGPPAKDLRY